MMKPEHAVTEYVWKPAKVGRIVITSEPGHGPGIDLFGQGTPNEGAEEALHRLIRDATEALAVWQQLEQDHKPTAPIGPFPVVSTMPPELLWVLEYLNSRGSSFIGNLRSQRFSLDAVTRATGSLEDLGLVGHDDRPAYYLTDLGRELCESDAYEQALAAAEIVPVAGP